jgi:hypothetical protein
MKRIYKLLTDFRIDKKYWYDDNLSLDDHINKRSKPAPYIRKMVEIAKMLNLKTLVEIGTNRFELKKECIDYFLDSERNALVSPACCCDGHSTLFFTECGFDVHTVDVNEACVGNLLNYYKSIGKEKPNNLNINIPMDGIQFLKDFDGKIDILYLDGWDVGTPEYAEKHLEAFQAAREKLSDIHLILIDDTDFNTVGGGKDNLLSPYLINEGYIPLFNGRQTLFINTTNVETNNEEYDFKKELEYKDDSKDIDMSFELTEFPNVILSLSTTPNRLSDERDGHGVKPVIENLLSLSYPNYEIHFNIPYINHKTSEEYVIPDWLNDYVKENDKLKIFRCHDYGSITKIAPTIKRISDPETTIITVDDDLIYEDGFIEYHLKKQTIYPDTALGFAGIGALDGSCHLCATMSKDTRVKIIEGYKSASYKRKFFNDDFFTDFVNKSWSDDIVISSYLGKYNISKIVMNYYKEDNFESRVHSFPILHVIPNEVSGCGIYRSENVDDNNNEFYAKGYL